MYSSFPFIFLAVQNFHRLQGYIKLLKRSRLYEMLHNINIEEQAFPIFVRFSVKISHQLKSTFAAS